MSDIERIQRLVEKYNIGDLIRELEQHSQEPETVFLHADGIVYEIGSLVQRQRPYTIIIEDNVDSGAENPWLHLAGDYDSFEAVKQAVQSSYGLQVADAKLWGNLDKVRVENFAANVHKPVGEIIYPMLAPNEAPTIRMIDILAEEFLD